MTSNKRRHPSPKANTDTAPPSGPPSERMRAAESDPTGEIAVPTLAPLARPNTAGAGGPRSGDRDDVGIAPDLLIQAIDWVQEGLLLMDWRGSVVHVNHAFERVSGYTLGELRGRSSFYLESPEPTQDLGLRLRQCLSTRTAWSGSGSLRRQDGSIHTGPFSITPTHNSRGELEGCVLRDLRNPRLEELETTIQQCQRMSTVGRLVGGVAHDFNNLIQAILGYASFAMEDLPAGAPGHRDLEQLSEVARRAAGLVRQLLVFARHELTRPEEVDLSEIVSSLVKTLKRVLGEHVELQLEAGNGPLRVWATPGQIEQLLVALCLNSRDAMPDGGQITVRLDEAGSLPPSNAAIPAEPDPAENAQPTQASPSGFVQLTVSDTRAVSGADSGLPPQPTSQRVWVTEHVAGADLGMSAVLEIAKRHAAIVTQEPATSGRSACHVFFPKTHPPRQPQEPPITMIPAASPPVLLLAEDDDSIRKIARRALEQAGFEVIVAADGLQAIQLFEENSSRLDIVLLDMVMPKANGTAVLNRIRTTHPQLPVIMTSGYNVDGMDSDNELDPHTTLFAKPYSPRTLIQRAQEILRSSSPASGSVPS